MSIRIAEGNPVCLYDSTDGVAFGPTFESVDHAEDFLEWLAANRNVSSTRGHYTAFPIWQRYYNSWFDERVDEDGNLPLVEVTCKPNEIGNHRREALRRLSDG